MIFVRKNRFKPIFKQFFLLRENVQNNKKLLKFKKKKWRRLIQQYKRKLLRYKKFKPKDQTQYLVTKYPSKGNAYNKRFRNTLRSLGRFRAYYGGLSEIFLKKKIRSVLKNNKIQTNVNTLFLELFESRLDTILYRAKFCSSIRSARQLIVHGKIVVNNTTVKSKNYQLKKGDLIAVKPHFNHVIEENIRQMQTLPFPPKYLFINYKTMQILIGNIKYTNLSPNFSFNLQLEKIVLNSLHH